MRKLVLAAALILVAGGAQAALIDRGHGFIYDTFQDITWAQNANINGSHDWQTQMTWAAGYSQHHSQYGTFDDWRLPTTLVPDPSCDNPTFATGYGCSGSEMGHLFRIDLIPAGPGWGPFTNGTNEGYWSSTPFVSGHDDDIYETVFDPTGSIFPPGEYFAQAYNSGADYSRHALAVRDGDIVPEPSTALLLSLGLVGLAAKGRRRNRS